MDAATLEWAMLWFRILCRDLLKSELEHESQELGEQKGRREEGQTERLEADPGR